MASFKKFSAAYVIVALIFGFVLVSSSVTAARVMGDGYCHYTGPCMNKQDCYSTCNTKHHTGGICIPDPRGGSQPRHNVCCCL
ncbi:hypothetical protein MKW94_023364 [Papaver nudicaule]|uniref:Uncharacterized protein n=1 Tax=Papaver nudicaule TaxID=74823 RepID=A0AA41VW71_PAPNU|nr:hypothetical protein [Papaver nudicaule]